MQVNGKGKKYDKITVQSTVQETLHRTWRVLSKFQNHNNVPIMSIFQEAVEKPEGEKGKFLKVKKLLSILVRHQQRRT